jgi:putative BNR repeat neuraminidase
MPYLKTFSMTNHLDREKRGQSRPTSTSEKSGTDASERLDRSETGLSLGVFRGFPIGSRLCQQLLRFEMRCCKTPRKAGNSLKGFHILGQGKRVARRPGYTEKRHRTLKGFNKTRYRPSSSSTGDPERVMNGCPQVLSRPDGCIRPFSHPRSSLFCFLALLLLAGLVSPAAAEVQVKEALDICPVWAGHPVGFCLQTHGNRQFAAFYDADRQMTIAARTLDSKEWRLVRLPTAVVWDSHNSVTMAVDDAGCLHVSGNMHCVPLIYFRTKKPWDIGTFEQVPAMVGREENKCTYPRFFRGADNELIYTYRIGSSGNGNQIYNKYDVKSRTWSRLLDTPLLDGEGKMNAYMQGPTRGPDGWFHLVWVWRDTPDCATNHDVSYARSKDLAHWMKSDGTALTLPMTLANSEIVDPVPPGGGVINGNTRLGFDAEQRPIISYHKYDADGHTQIHNARLEDGAWKSYQVTDWDYRWEFSGGGTILWGVSVSGVVVEPDGTLAQSFSNRRDGGGTWRLDADTFKPLERIHRKATRPPGVGKLESSFEGMGGKWCSDSGNPPAGALRYMLRWETLGANRDRPRTGPLPEPSMLRLYGFSRD